MSRDRATAFQPGNIARLRLKKKKEKEKEKQKNILIDTVTPEKHFVRACSTNCDLLKKLLEYILKLVMI